MALVALLALRAERGIVLVAIASPLQKPIDPCRRLADASGHLALRLPLRLCEREVLRRQPEIPIRGLDCLSGASNCLVGVGDSGVAHDKAAS
jgi:hypothetical protein